VVPPRDRFRDHLVRRRWLGKARSGWVVFPACFRHQTIRRAPSIAAGL